ncbi:Putative ribonuclease H protein At1g65750 [Linum perenne]
MPLTQNLGNYLGVPVLHDRTTSRTYQKVLDRIDSKLSGWKAKTLSLAGRVALAQSVLAAIPAYVMQIAVIPVTTCEEIDKRIRNFVWGTTAETRKICLVAWERVCLPKEKGGLGLRLARQLNRAFLTKLAFTFLKEKDKLSVQVLQQKYFRQNDEGLVCRNLRSVSPLWKGITRDWETMISGSKSAIRDGTETMFWTNNWVDANLQLLDFADTSSPDFDRLSTVASMVNAEGQWDFQKLERLLAPEAVDVVAGMTPPSEERGPDDWVWGLEASGQFSIKSAYNLICNTDRYPESTVWKGVWKWVGPNRIKHFLRLAANNKLLTNVARRSRGLSADELCSRCGTEEETCIHVLRDCDFAKATWTEVGGFDINGDGWKQRATDWFNEYLGSKDWLEKDWELKVKHIYREANQAADYLANKGHRLARGYHSVPLLDCNLVYYIRHDCMGISVPRLVH